MGDSISATAEYNELLDSIKRTLAAGQLRAARAVNNALVETYWQIGRDIVVRRREQGWGAKVTDRLATDLRTAILTCAACPGAASATWLPSPPAPGDLGVLRQARRR
jgi:hypothetical protein